MFSYKSAIGFVCSLLILVATPSPSYAQVVVTQVQELNFGKWFFDGNNAPVTITVTPTGTYNQSGSITMFTAPKPGIYNITGLPANTTFNSVNVTMTQALILGGKSFTLDNFTSQIPDADGSGNTQLRLGGEAMSSGDGQVYGGGVYNGQIDIELDY